MRSGLGNNPMLGGSIPATINQLSNLTALFWDSTRISGSLPPSLSALVQMQVMTGDFTGITGAIPDVFSGFSGLSVFTVSNTQLSGTVPPSLQLLTTLHVLDLFKTSIGGCWSSNRTIPTCNVTGLSFCHCCEPPPSCGAVLTYSCNSCGDPSLVVDGPLTLNSSYNVPGNVTFLTSAALVIPLTTSQAPSLVVSGCVNFSGNLTFDAQGQPLPDQVVVAQFGCSSGQFARVSIVNATACEQDDIATSNLSSSELIYLFSSYTTSCGPPVGPQSFIPGLSFTAALAVVICAPLALLLAVVAVLLLAVPTIRQRLFPFRDRPFYQVTRRNRS